MWPAGNLVWLRMSDAERHLQASALVCVSWETRRSRRRHEAAVRSAGPLPEAVFTELHLVREDATITLCGRRPPAPERCAVYANVWRLRETATPIGLRAVVEARSSGGCVTCAAKAAILNGEHERGAVEVVQRTRSGAASQMAATCRCGWREAFGVLLAFPNEQWARAEELHLDHVVRVCREALGVDDRTEDG